MIHPGYSDSILENARRTLDDEGQILLQSVLTEESFQELRDSMRTLPHKRHFHPLRHSWHMAKEKHVKKELETHALTKLLERVTGKRLEASFYMLKSGDFSLLHDALESEHGFVAFFDLSREWHHSWGGYIGIGGEQYDLVPNSLLIMEVHGHQWFIKRIRHGAGAQKALLIFKES